MTDFAEWHLIQFTADMRRREPRNIGVVATLGRDTAVRLFGVHSSSGEIDGHRLRRYRLTKDDYAPWVDYYMSAFGDGGIDRIKHSQRHRPTEFRLISGGYTEVSGQSASEFADHLFAELVDDDSSTREDYSKVLRYKVDTVLKAAEVSPEHEVTVDGTWGERHDLIRFDYGLTVGDLYLMDRLQLHQSSLELSKMVARDFNARARAVTEAGTGSKFIAFYSNDVVVGHGTDAMLAPLWEMGHIIDVDQTRQAVQSLRECLAA